MFDLWIAAVRKVYSPNILLFLAEGLKNTLYIAVVTIVLSLLFGTVLAFLRFQKIKVFGALAACYIEIIRNIPLTLFIIAMRFMTKLPPLVSGIAAMTVFTSAIAAEIIRGGLNNVQKGQWEAAYSQGFSVFGALRYVVVPQALEHIRSPLISQFVTTIKDTSFCAVVGTYDLTFTSKIVASHRSIVTMQDIMVVYATVALIYYVVNLFFSKWARRSRGNAAKGVVR